MEHNNQRQLVDEYFARFPTGDNPKILATLVDDVVWVIHGHWTIRGKVEFDGEIANPAFEGRPVLAIEHSYQDCPVVISTGAGRGTSVAGGPFEFVFNDVFTFRGGLISRVESYIVPLHLAFRRIKLASRRRSRCLLWAVGTDATHGQLNSVGEDGAAATRFREHAPGQDALPPPEGSL